MSHRIGTCHKRTSIDSINTKTPTPGCACIRNENEHLHTTNECMHTDAGTQTNKQTNKRMHSHITCAMQCKFLLDIICILRHLHTYTKNKDLFYQCMLTDGL